MVFIKYPTLYWLLGLLLSLPLASRAQIVDDSTKVVYGPKTTRVIFEGEVLRDSVRGTPIDTTLTTWPQARYWLHDTTFQQDLGALGTASRPLLYQPNYQLGARPGRNVFDRNTRDASQVPYYDSRSPYSFFRYVQSTSGEQVFELNYTRSLQKNFSIGANYERIASNQILATAGTQPLVEHNNFTIFGRYQTEDGRYHLLANYSASRQRTYEQGGIRPYQAQLDQIARKGGDLDTLFTYGDARVYLTGATNIDDRDQFHLFHSYRLLGRGLTAYHVLDVRRQFNGYTDTAIPYDGSTLLFYSTTLRNRTATNDRATYRQLENTFGFTGHTDQLAYTLYTRVRQADFASRSTITGQAGAVVPLQPVADHTYTQLFAGGTAALTYLSRYAVDVAGEVKPSFSQLEYWLQGRIRTGPLSAELLLNSYSPTLTQQEFIGNHYQWQNLEDASVTSAPNTTLRNTKTQQLTLRLQQKLPALAEHSLEASLRVVNIFSLVYYDATGRPNQLAETQKQLFIATARHRFRVGSVYVDNQATYTAGGNGEGLRIPALVTESRVYYQHRVFGHALFAQVGGEVYSQSKFRAYGYSPSTQQFYVQDGFTIRNYAVADAFVAADISSAAIFLKVAYLNQGVLGNGYFTTPFYSGYPRRFQFGVRWRFYN
ncbi:MAG: putative porin [Janthinobacterium lividum]